jgi:hypothetical protein
MADSEKTQKTSQAQGEKPVEQKIKEQRRGRTTKQKLWGEVDEAGKKSDG